MIVGPEIYGLLLLLTTLPAAWFVRLSWDKRDKPGGRWLILTFVGMAGWTACWALMLLFDRPDLSVASLNGVLFFVNVAVIGWVM